MKAIAWVGLAFIVVGVIITAQGLPAKKKDDVKPKSAVVQMQFKHDVPLKRWIGVVKDNLEQARAAGLITADLERRVGDGLPQAFEPLRERGYEKGDRLLYELGPDSLRTVVEAADGHVLLDRFERDPGTRSVVLASYFAPRSDFREPLLRSLLEPAR